ncbi:TIR domain-containing protein [Saccharopolyspora sp. ID03-671]|uniref:toll/interleukin-1 receptor domain-containing protein n=1 Tax=Saccharopolyspora sp. ID03-671 TaxID=3073066 RepID=UPI00324D4BB6
MSPPYDYDVAVTFAGEDRGFVESVVDAIKDAGYRVFYDQDEEATLWGEDLTEYLADVYEERARYAVMFISRHYAAKLWTRHERRSVLQRGLEQATPYLLPVRLDDTPLPGVRSSIGFLDGRTKGAVGVAKAVLQKLKGTSADGYGSFNGYVPRSEHEATVLVGERPDGWEYLLFAYSVVSGMEALHDRYLDHRMEFAHQAGFVGTHELSSVVERELATAQGLTRNLEAVLASTVQESAFGPPGVPGNVDEIRHFASRVVDVYRSFIDWADRIRGYATPTDEGHKVLRALARYSTQPVERLRRFAYEFRDEVDPMHAKLIAGEPVKIQITLSLEVSPEDSGEFDKTFDVFLRSHHF